MNLDHLLATIGQSAAADWNVIRCRPLPSYRGSFEYSSQGGKWQLRHHDHKRVAAYRPDVMITMAWGLDADEHVSTDWASAVSGGQPAAKVLLDIFYANALVHRSFLLAVDGGRALLPQPVQADGRAVSADAERLARLVARLEGREDRYADYFTRAGLTISDSPAPASHA